MKEGHRYIGSNSLPETKFLRVPIGTFYLAENFFSNDLLRFWSLGYPRSRGQVGRVILALRIFPQLVGRSVQNLVKIGLVV